MIKDKRKALTIFLSVAGIAAASAAVYHFFIAPPEKTGPGTTAGNGTTTFTGGGPVTAPPAGVDIKAFQLFANTKGAGLTADGLWGPKTAVAWSQFGTAFTTPTTTTPPPPAPPSSAVGKTAKASNSNIRVLNPNGTLYKSDYTYNSVVGSVAAATGIEVWGIINSLFQMRKSFTNEAGVFETANYGGFTNEYYKLNTSAGVKYVLKSSVNIS